MCGIAGQFRLSINKNMLQRQDELLEMLEAMRHRGPDDGGFFLSNELIMGMRRLSILDLNTGKQPIYNEDKTVGVVFNGEIYNYLELKEDLTRKGHVFYTTTDTEVLVHLYEEYGDNFSNYLNGMFAYALWDSKKEKFILSRDRMGEKPLYYSIMDSTLYFASEIKSILVCDGIAKKINKEAINELLTFNYIPYPKTAFENIFRLEPASTIIVDGGKISKTKYWKIPTRSKVCENLKLQSEVNNLIEDSTKIRLRSDVEIGAFLSGGIDSTITTKFMSENIKSQFKTFSIGFEEEIFNELGYANTVSEKYGTEQVVEIIKNTNFMQGLIDAIWFCENPHGDVSFTPTYILSKLASKHLKVVLTGDGGDEIFGGYDKYLNYKYDSNYDINQNFRNYFDSISVFNWEGKKDVLTEQFLNELESKDPFEKIESKYKEIHQDDFINKILYFDADYLLEGNNLVKPDRMGMANSIEARYPFLDYRIVELLFSVHSKNKIVDGEKKVLLKNVLKNDFDKEFIYRKKQMFTVPIGEWFKNEEFRILVERVFISKQFVDRNFFKQSKVLSMLNDHVTGKDNYTRELRLILIIELWCRIYIDHQFSNKPSIENLI